MEWIRWRHGFSYNGQHVQEQTATHSSVQDKLLHGHLVSSKLRGLIWKKSIFSLVRPHQVIHQVIHLVIEYAYEVDTGWLIPFVDKRVGGRQNCVNPVPSSFLSRRWSLFVGCKRWTVCISFHKLFTSCIRRCLVSRACDWVMSALSAVLLNFSFQFSLLFFIIGR